MNLRSPQYANVEDGDLSQLGIWCERFDELMQSGQSPRIEDVLKGVAPNQQAVVFEELLAMELEYLASNNTPTTSSDYSGRFPDFPEQIASAFAFDNEEEKKTSKQGQRLQPTPVYKTPERIGDFRIVRELGRGGMGVVYEAEQISLGRRVALKLLASNVLSDGKHHERFEREARAAAGLQHANIVPVFATGCEDGVSFIAMQLIRGLSLDSVIAELRNRQSAGPTTAPVCLKSIVREHQGATTESARTVSVGSGTVEVETSTSSPMVDAQPGSPSGLLVERDQYWRDLADVIRQAAEGLDHAHQHSVLHRDIKPGNLLLNAQGQTWITDFGMAKAKNSQELTQSGTLLGTLKYLPPEAFDDGADHRGDIYSLGLTLYELCALRSGYSDDDQNQLIRRVLHEAPPPLSSLKSGCPRDLETIINKAIERDSAGRYETAAAFADDLRRFISDEPIEARPPSTAKLLAKAVSRNKLVASLVIVTTVLVLALAIGSSLFRNLNTELQEVRSQEETNTPKLTDEPPALSDNSSEPSVVAPPIDVLAQLASGFSSADGQWSMQDDVLVAKAYWFSKVQLPVRPSGNYRVTTTFTRRSGKDHFGVQLPLKTGSVVFLVDANAEDGGASGLDWLDGVGIGEQPDTVFGIQTETDQSHTLVLTVRQSEVDVSVAASLDGKPFYAWSGKQSQAQVCQPYRMPDPRCPGLHAFRCHFEVTAMQVEQIAN